MSEPVPLGIVVIGDRIKAEVVGPEEAESGDVFQLGGDPFFDPGEQRLRVSDRPRAAGESGQRPTISGAVERAAAARAATIRSAAFLSKYSWRSGRPPDAGRARTQSSMRTSATFTPRRFCDSRLPGSSICWKT